MTEELEGRLDSQGNNYGNSGLEMPSGLITTPPICSAARHFEPAGWHRECLRTTLSGSVDIRRAGSTVGVPPLCINGPCQPQLAR